MLEAVNKYRPDNVMAIPSHFQAVSCVVSQKSDESQRIVNGNFAGHRGI